MKNAIATTTFIYVYIYLKKEPNKSQWTSRKGEERKQIVHVNDIIICEWLEKPWYARMKLNFLSLNEEFNRRILFSHWCPSKRRCK